MLGSGAWGDFGKLALWGFSKERAKDPRDTTRRTSGVWRITQRGIEFVCGVLRVPSHVWIYNNQSLGFTGDSISVLEALGRRFDYAELMRTGGT